MAEEKYTPPEVWEWDNQSGGKFTNINRPISGATHEKIYQEENILFNFIL